MMRWIGGAISLGFLSLACVLFVPVSERDWTCVACRMKRVDATTLGVTRSNLRPNECSRWYAEHVEPWHAHVWARMAGATERNFLGMPLGVISACNPPPIQFLPPPTQLRAYQHFGDPREARKLFGSLTDATPYDVPISEDRRHLTVKALREWESRGFPGAWDEWWDGFHARYLEERKAYAAWRDSDPGLGFHDWRKPGAE